MSLLGFKPYYKTAVVKPLCTSMKTNTQINGTELELSACLYGQFNLRLSRQRIYNREKDSLFNGGVRKTVLLCVIESIWTVFLTPHTKINSKVD